MKPSPIQPKKLRTLNSPTVAAYIVRNVNLLAQGMPSPRAPEGDWVAYEQARFEFKPYEVGRDLFYQDQADRVAE